MSTPTNPAQSSANLFRRLAWQASIPLEIRLAEGEPGAGSGCDRYYVSGSLYSSSGYLGTRGEREAGGERREALKRDTGATRDKEQRGFEGWMMDLAVLWA